MTTSYGNSEIELIKIMIQILQIFCHIEIIEYLSMIFKWYQADIILHIPYISRIWYPISWFNEINPYWFVIVCIHPSSQVTILIWWRTYKSDPNLNNSEKNVIDKDHVIIPDPFLTRKCHWNESDCPYRDLCNCLRVRDQGSTKEGRYNRISFIDRKGRCRESVIRVV